MRHGTRNGFFAPNCGPVTRLTCCADELVANHKLSLTVDGAEPTSMEDVLRYVKVDANYDKSILGTWEAVR